MGKALYRQYRSTSFDEVIGQDHITTTLKNILSSGSIGHAYLLTGPRGVGKTSVARLLAFAVNDLPYQKDSIHLDIIEIDAASNRRIDEIRALRERVHIAPTSGKYKVYIIDEVHMLTREAFNALLKTLEEPPAHVIFILATTEIHKLPDTIISRCVTFTFQPISLQNLTDHLKHIAKSENFNVSEEALALLASHGDGSFRDSISLLDQVKSQHSKITAQDIELALGLASKETVATILEAVKRGEPKQLSIALEKAYQYGANETKLAKQISENIRQALLNNSSFLIPSHALELLSELLNVPASPKPRAKLELCLLKVLFVNSPVLKSTVDLDSQPTAESQTNVNIKNKLNPHLSNFKKSASPKTVVTEASLNVNETLVTTEKDMSKEPSLYRKLEKNDIQTDENDDLNIWNDILQKLKVQNNTLYGIARMAEAKQQDNTLSLYFKFPFHFRQVSQAKNKSVIVKIAEDMGLKELKLSIVQAESSKKAAKGKNQDVTLENITNIFGDSEVLES